jgi:FtsP/CotA-like multicopper oxidase with cupredoxin domain
MNLHFCRCRILPVIVGREILLGFSWLAPDLCPWARSSFCGVRGCIVALCLLTQATRAENVPNGLNQPPVCSAETAGQPPLNENCTVKRLGNGHNEVRVNLTAQTSFIDVGGYKVQTENYNGNYLTPVLEVMPGDTVAAHLENHLLARKHGGMVHGDADENPTNLHYFHGGIVSPNNPRPHVELGTGDNIYVHLKSGGHFDLKVPIPGDKTLDARVLEENGDIDHPSGLNWYHSHLHGISSDQVIGGMSGLLSVGDAKANVKAACKKNTPTDKECLNPVDKDTTDLKAETVVKYVLLRDIPLNAKTLPEDASGADAVWEPQTQDFPTRPNQTPEHKECGVWNKEGSKLELEAGLRKGFCQFDKESLWLFTLNGQRFPTITVAENQNLLLRIGNVSANVAYSMELCKEAAFELNKCSEADGSVLPLTILSLDGVVPAKPVSPLDAGKPVAAFDVPNLLLMPASRVEIYVRNDNKSHPQPQTYVLRTKGLDAGTDKWPEIALARIVLQPNSFESQVVVARNAPVKQVLFRAQLAVPEEVKQPVGCVRDLEDAKTEYRRVTFLDPEIEEGPWRIKTEIVHPKVPHLEKDQPTDPSATVGPVTFKDYEQSDGLVNWNQPLHVCIFIDHDAAHKGSHKQLWVLNNRTSALHNFHIHQIKFRLATKKELEDHLIDLGGDKTPSLDKTTGSDIKLYDDQSSSEIDSESKPVWHDTIPIPPFQRVFIIMSFDAKQQVGRFVYHCHILKHEDNGLMAPIEVWEPTSLPQ